MCVGGEQEENGETGGFCPGPPNRHSSLLGRCEASPVKRMSDHAAKFVFCLGFGGLGWSLLHSTY